VNPYSGRGLSKAVLGTIVSQLCDGDYFVTVFTTKNRNTAELAREYGAEYDLVICAGGDGTLSDVVAGLMDLASPPPIGYIPTGTANDMATTLALSRNPQTALNKILGGTATPLDVGKIGDEYFTYIAAFGAFTGVSYQTPQSAKRALGHLAYVLGGIGAIGAIKPLHTIVTYDGGEIEGDFIFGGVTNSTSVAGLVRLDPDKVALGDGLFEIILVRQPLEYMDFHNIIVDLTTKQYTSDNVIMLHSSQVTFRFDTDVAWTRDGEDGGVHRELSVENCPAAMRIII
jgi:YegS/Rv2252/BmrU family lipid kinase